MINDFRGKYFFLSNFFPCTVKYEDIIYPSTEHAFQAVKSLDPEERKRIAQILNPSLVKRAGRRVKLRKDWEEVKVQLMYEIVKAKFTQNESLKERLLKTGEEPLQEGNTWHDIFWGVCNGRGQNHLGKILMRVRNELKVSG